jgi:ectoine hydroxylase-related dioxygenase (phytanoyl-CoA dioxygenase family)
VAAEPQHETELDRLADELVRDGICTIPGLIPRDKVERWRATLDALVAEREQVPGGLAPRGPGRHYLTLPWLEPFADPEIFANATVLGVLDRVFAQEYVMVQLGADIAGRGSENQEIHRDYRPLFEETIVTPLYALAVNFPLVEVTEENGPFQMARGTHVLTKEDGLAKIETGELPLESLLAQPGDVTIRTPLALHRGTENRTGEPRPMVVLGYAMHWLHTPDVKIDVPRALFESWPEQTRSLLRCNVVEELGDQPETYLKFAF